MINENVKRICKGEGCKKELPVINTRNVSHVEINVLKVELI